MKKISLTKKNSPYKNFVSENKMRKIHFLNDFIEEESFYIYFPSLLSTKYSQNSFKCPTS